MKAKVDLGWHVISGELLLEYLRRAALGENPDLLFAELWANAEQTPTYEEEDSDY